MNSMNSMNNMNNTIKQFSTLLINFIDKNLVPVLDNRVSEMAKAIHKWTTLKNYIIVNEIS